MKHIKFNSVEIRKSQFFDWLTSSLEHCGWVNVASNPSTEGWIYQSKGQDGKSDIIVNFRNGYDGHNSNSFTTTAGKHFDIKMLVSYTPNETIGKDGIHVPTSTNGNFTRINVGTGISNFYPDQKLKIHYNCNKNRMIFLVTTSATTVFCMFGRPDNNYAKEYKDTGNMIFTTNNYKLGKVGSWGIADRPTTNYTAMEVLYNPIDNGFYKNKLLLCEIGFGSTLEGIKGYLEGIYYIPFRGKQGAVTSMTGDKCIDELGNEYTLFYMCPADSTNYTLTLPTGHIAICTKLAGEE